MRYLIFVFLILTEAARAGSIETETDKGKIMSALSKQSAKQFCEKTLRNLARTDFNKWKQPYAEAVVDVAIRDHGFELKELRNIASRSFEIGSSECALVAALGAPTKTNATTTARSRRVQWVYRDRGMYVYTLDGKVNSYQD